MAENNPNSELSQEELFEKLKKQMMDIDTPDANPEEPLQSREEIIAKIKSLLKEGKYDIGVVRLLRRHGVDWPTQEIKKLCTQYREQLGLPSEKDMKRKSKMGDMKFELLIIGGGLLLMAIGIGISVAAEGAVIFYGLVVVGAITVLKGLWGLFKASTGRF